jgi:hypothetical protein
VKTHTVELSAGIRKKEKKGKSFENQKIKSAGVLIVRVYLYS